MNDPRWSLAVCDVPDFPSPGIVFKDITPLWSNPELFAAAIEEMSAPFRGDGVRKVVGIEARGFVFGSAVALALGAGFVPARKPGKLPRERRRVDYTLEYGVDALEIHHDAVGPGEACLLVDDVLATGGTARAAADLIRSAGARLVGMSFFLEIGALDGRERLGRENVHCVLSL
ncbi:MAG TPA: adenine phosphoribosyltransferase [Thermoanaerobaculia bacterium]|jgi:adenine phosphoribosyltransferase|nr:adenine phosphoribosyltransferase [Thermoanaerobaculia bacterium]